MSVLLTGVSSYTQFLAVLGIFVFVLGATAFVTKWFAGYQKQQNVECNIEVLETAQLASNRYIQLVRIGETYIAIAVCKDVVTMLCEIPKEQIKEMTGNDQKGKFQELLMKTMKKHSEKSDDTEEI